MTEPYGCFDRAEFREQVAVQDGWYDVPGTNVRIPKIKAVPFRMRRDCSYANETVLGRNDSRCVGCKWRLNDDQLTKQPM